MAEANHRRLPGLLPLRVPRALVHRRGGTFPSSTRSPPSAALDAEAEHALFERWAAAVHKDVTAVEGRITVLVSHRFSTVRMADLIVVLDGARVVEAGTHEYLLAKGGQYAELYGIRTVAYR